MLSLTNTGVRETIKGLTCMKDTRNKRQLKIQISAERDSCNIGEKVLLLHGSDKKNNKIQYNTILYNTIIKKEVE